MPHSWADQISERAQDIIPDWKNEAAWSISRFKVYTVWVDSDGLLTASANDNLAYSNRLVRAEAYFSGNFLS